MFTHVVVMTLKDPAHIDDAVARLRAMEGRIPALRAIEVGKHDGRDPRGEHLVLITRHDDADGLRAYAEHPVHVEVVTWLKTLLASARVVDWQA